MTELATNVLYSGDNLDILRRYLPDASVDLIYLDPPFNSNRDSNVIFKDESGNPTDAQLLAFEDTSACACAASRYRSGLNDGLVTRLPSQLEARNRTGVRILRRRSSPDQRFWIDVEVTSPDDRSPPDTNRPEPLVVATKRLKHRSPQSVSQASLDFLPVAEPQPNPIVVEWCHGLNGQHSPMLAERRNLLRWQLSTREFPVRLELGLVHQRPLNDQSKHSARQLPTQDG